MFNAITEEYKNYFPPIAIIKTITMKKSAFPEIEEADFEVVSDIIKSVYHMQTTMPELGMFIENKLKEMEYVVTFTGLKSIDHAFIIHLASKGLTFIERFEIMYNTLATPTVKFSNTLLIKIYIRKSCKQSTFVFVPLSQLNDDEDDCPVSVSNGKRTARTVENGTDSECDNTRIDKYIPNKKMLLTNGIFK